MNQESPDCVELGAACRVLVKSTAVHTLVKKRVGAKHLAAALALLQSGKLEGPLGDKLHEFLSDTIENKSQAVWSGLIPQEYDEYPVNVMEFNGIFWVNATNYDPIGYFLSVDEAVSFTRSNWDDVYEVSEESGPGRGHRRNAGHQRALEEARVGGLDPGIQAAQHGCRTGRGRAYLLMGRSITWYGSSLNLEEEFNYDPRGIFACGPH